MATQKPRMYVTLSAEARAALDKFSEASGVASSSFVSQLIDDAIPVILATADAIAIAKRSPQQASDAMREALAVAVSRGVQSQLAFDNDLQRKKKLRKRRR